MNIEINKLRKEYDKSFYTNEPLSKYSWFNLGGRAEFFFRPKNEIELTKFLKTLGGQKKRSNISTGIHHHRTHNNRTQDCIGNRPVSL